MPHPTKGAPSVLQCVHCKQCSVCILLQLMLYIHEEERREKKEGNMRKGSRIKGRGEKGEEE